MSAEQFEWSAWFAAPSGADDEVPWYFTEERRHVDGEDAAIYCAALFAAGATLADRLGVPRRAVVFIARAAIYEMAFGPVARTDAEEMRLALAGAAKELSRLYGADSHWCSGS